MKVIILTIVPALILAGCLSPKISLALHSPNEAPHWLTQLPKQEGWIYAVGSAGKTYFPEDAKHAAIENARIALAKSISVEISSISISGTAGRDQHSEFIEVSEERLQQVLANSEIESVWFDEIGCAGPNNTYYALARMKRPSR